MPRDAAASVRMRDALRHANAIEAESCEFV